MSTLDNIQINFVTDSDGHPIQKVESGDPSSAGSVTDIVDSELFTQNFELNQEQLDNANPFNWWGTKDLELYLPFVISETIEHATPMIAGSPVNNK